MERMPDGVPCKAYSCAHHMGEPCDGCVYIEVTLDSTGKCTKYTTKKEYKPKRLKAVNTIINPCMIVRG